MKREFMAQAIALAIDNVRSGCGGPFGVVIVKDGKVIATGANLVTSANDPTAHAEIVAIRRACSALTSFQLDGCELYSTCEPCPMCLGAIYWSRLEKVYFACRESDAAAAGFDDSFIYEQLSVAQDRRKIPFVSLMREEGLACFHEWESKKDRVLY